MKFFIGSYGEGIKKGIYTYIYESNAAKEVDHIIMSDNPSSLIRFNDNIYCALRNVYNNDEDFGGVQSFVIENGHLNPKDILTVHGDSYVHIGGDEEFIIASNFYGGTFVVLRVNNGKIIRLCDEIQHTKTGPVPRRQECSRMHFAGFTPDKKYLYVTNLGGDEIVFYTLNRDSGKVSQVEDMTIHTTPGSGPRNVVFNCLGNIMYVVNEISNDIDVYNYDNGVFTNIQKISTIPNDYSEFTATAAIQITSEGKYLFVTNRGYNSIAMYRIMNNKLELLSFLNCYGSQPRDMKIVDDKYLIIANQETNQVVIIEIDYNNYTGILKATIDIAQPVCICL